MSFFSTKNCRSFVNLACLSISLLEYQSSDVRIKIMLLEKFSKYYSQMPYKRVFSTVKGKGKRGGGNMAAFILKLDIRWKRSESHLVTLRQLKSSQYPLNTLHRKINAAPFRNQTKTPRMSNTQPTDPTDSSVPFYFPFLQSFLSEQKST